MKAFEILELAKLWAEAYTAEVAPHYYTGEEEETDLNDNYRFAIEYIQNGGIDTLFDLLIPALYDAYGGGYPAESPKSLKAAVRIYALLSDNYKKSLNLPATVAELPKYFTA